MKKKKYIILFVLIVLSIGIILGNKVSFYKFDTSISSYNFSTEKSIRNDIKDNILYFAIENDNLMLKNDVLLDNSNINVFALTKDSVKEVDRTSEKLDKRYIGSFFAIAPEIEVDIDDDGTKDKVWVGAKGDTLLTKGGNAKFSSFDKIPFEVVLSRTNQLTFYFNGEVLANKEVHISTENKSNESFCTNEKGIIDDIKLKDIRNGLNFKYKDSDGKYYLLSYMLEENSIFTHRHLEAMIPIFCILGISLGIIVIIISIRALKNKKHFKNIKSQITIVKDNSKNKKTNKYRFSMQTFRWICMTLSFVVLVYGGRIVGKTFSEFKLPTFDCPKNGDQFVGSTCYNLSHLNTFLQGNITEILTFFITTFVIIVLFGRTLCGFVCPFGFIQDILDKIRQILKIEGIHFTEKMYNILKQVKWMMVILFFGGCTVGLNFCNICPAISTSPAFNGFKISLSLGGFLLIFIIVMSFFKRRFWCNICPLGLFIGLFSKISIFKIRKNCQSCTECGGCYDACPIGIKEIYTEREKEDITSNDCIMCGECVKKCPEDEAISMAVIKKRFYISSRFKFFGKKKKRKRRY